MTDKQCPLTTSNGAPVADDDASISAGERGSLTFDNFRMFEKLTHFNRERIPERIVHARGSAAYGTFTLTSDYARDPRGFAVKFYTDQGNWDMVGNNTPVFFLRDPIKFPDFVHSQKKNLQTNLPDAAAVYEFWANSPQSLHQMSDRGIPKSYRHMDGFSSHTLSLWNSIVMSKIILRKLSKPLLAPVTWCRGSVLRPTKCCRRE